MKKVQKLEFRIVRNVVAVKKHPNTGQGTRASITCHQKFKAFQTDSNGIKGIQTEKPTPAGKKPRQPFSPLLTRGGSARHRGNSISHPGRHLGVNSTKFDQK